MATETPSLRRRKPLGFMTLLSSAACEWFLMFLLFVNAALSYLLTKFAQYCELETPCLLCSRLDNGLKEKKPGSYWSLLCSNHREEISSFVSCSIHSKFADVHGMCEECLNPFAMQNKSNPESYRLLVGKSWVDVDRSGLQNLMLNKHIHIGSPNRRTCSCCDKIWRSKSNAERLIDLNSVGDGASKANVKPPLPRAPGRSRFSRRDSLKRLRDKLTGPTTHQSTGSKGTVDTLSHVGYTKLKFSSDSESEVPYSEDDDDGNTSCHSKCFDFDKKRSISKPLAEVASSEKDFGVNVSILDQPNLLDLSEHKNVDSLSSDALAVEPPSSSTPQLISLYDDQPGLDEGAWALCDGPAEDSQIDVCLPHVPAISMLSELLSLCSAPSLSNDVTITTKIIIGGITEKDDTFVEKHIEAASEPSSDDVCSLASKNTRQADAWTQTDEETRELSDRHASDQPMNTIDSAETEENAKAQPHVLPSELEESRAYEDSNSQVVQVPVSPKKNDLYEDSNSEVVQVSVSPKKNDSYEDSNSEVVQVSVSPKKNDSNYESSDGNTVSDVEGEDIVDRLKRQVEHDRNCMNSLYKELEEERNAAAIAANQAMAMITRLQEEKAALHMEALQYLRMMEEQAEYDMEALERANDVLAEKEKELQDLEYELEFYRNNFLDGSGVHKIQRETSAVDNRVESRADDSSNSKAAKFSIANGNCKPTNGAVRDFEDEKMYISQCLKTDDHLDFGILETSIHARICDSIPT